MDLGSEKGCRKCDQCCRGGSRPLTHSVSAPFPPPMGHADHNMAEATKDFLESPKQVRILHPCPSSGNLHISSTQWHFPSLLPQAGFIQGANPSNYIYSGCRKGRPHLLLPLSPDDLGAPGLFLLCWEPGALQVGWGQWLEWAGEAPGLPVLPGQPKTVAVPFICLLTACPTGYPHEAGSSNCTSSLSTSWSEFTSCPDAADSAQASRAVGYWSCWHRSCSVEGGANHPQVHPLQYFTKHKET